VPQEQIKRELEQLRDDLQAIHAAEGDTPEAIDHMLSHVNQVLDKFDERAHHEPLLAHMQESIMKFEVEHPQLSDQINSLIQSLTNAGL
jgi:hypothetical protein